MPDNVRVRIAPSPTGDPHIGTLRTALFNYLYAKQHSGKFVFRLEDTDKTREVAGSFDKLEESLSWIGIDPDEGPVQGGSFGPYIQSERLKLYEDFARQLVCSGKAYYCFCTPERLANLREEQTKKKLPPKYDRLCRGLSQAQIKKKIDSNQPFVIRMSMPDNESVEWSDIIKGRLIFNSNDLDDQVLLKSDGYPTYHLASVVDDHLMEISHVLRGEDWLSSTPKHLLLYKSFGWNPPIFGHFPLITNPDRSKLSKRNNNTSVLYYKVDKGYHPMALTHFMVFLGWTPEKIRDFYSIDMLVQDFSLDRVGVSPAVFDLDHLNFLGKKYLSESDLSEIVSMYLSWINDRRHVFTIAEKKFIELYKTNHPASEAMIDVCRRRASYFVELSEQLKVFFGVTEPLVVPNDLTIDGKIDPVSAKKSLTVAKKIIQDIDLKALPKETDKRINVLIEIFKREQPNDLGGQAYLHPSRVALTLCKQSMNAFEFLSVILLLGNGKELMVERLEGFIDRFKS